MCDVQFRLVEQLPLSQPLNSLHTGCHYWNPSELLSLDVRDTLKNVPQKSSLDLRDQSEKNHDVAYPIGGSNLKVITTSPARDSFKNFPAIHIESHQQNILLPPCGKFLRHENVGWQNCRFIYYIKMTFAHQGTRSNEDFYHLHPSEAGNLYSHNIFQYNAYIAR